MKKYLFFCIVAAIFIGCGNEVKNDSQQPCRCMHEAKRAMYHWKNCVDFYEESSFIEQHKVERLYIRFFDVTLEQKRGISGMEAIPTATVRFNEYYWGWMDYIPEIVPTIFITPDAIEDMHRKKEVQTIARKMLERIRNMCSFYGIPKEKVTEIQLDCDWTSWSEQPFFEFCKEVRRQMREDALLSSTIRLHQLRRSPPPVDYGVLMLYNTNNLRDPSVENSILSAEDVKPYLKNVKYDLPLDFAYPTFSWDIWFHDGKFRGIVRSESKADSLRQAGEFVRHEEVDYQEIMKVKELVEKHIKQPNRKSSTILYHLDQNSLKRYTSDEIETIFSL